MARIIKLVGKDFVPCICAMSTIYDPGRRAGNAQILYTSKMKPTQNIPIFRIASLILTGYASEYFIATSIVDVLLLVAGKQFEQPADSSIVEFVKIWTESSWQLELRR